MKKIKLLLLLGFIMSALALQAQRKVDLNIKVQFTQKVKSDKAGDINVGDKLFVQSIYFTSLNTSTSAVNHYFALDKDNQAVDFYCRPSDFVLVDESPEAFWKYQYLAHGVYNNMYANGYQYDLRRDLEEDGLDYIKTLSQNRSFFEDAYLEDHILNLVHRLAPVTLGDGRLGQIGIRIVKDIRPVARFLPNGTILINTGLLCVLKSDEELAAVLSREIAHFLLDHPVININKATQRAKRAAFWSTVAGLAVLAGETYAAIKTDGDYRVGDLAYPTFAASTEIALQVLSHLGMQYDIAQEQQATKVAKELFVNLNLNEAAFDGTSFDSLQYRYDPNLALTKPSVPANVKVTYPNSSKTKIERDPKYDVLISNVLSYTGRVELYTFGHYQIASNFINRVINTKIATEEDYIAKAVILMALYDNLENNQEAYRLLQKAVVMHIYPISNVHKQLALVCMRMAKKEEAIKELSLYLDLLKAENNPRLSEEVKWSILTLNKWQND